MSVELKELQESARQVISGTDVPAAEDVIWSQLVELGWLMVAVPEALGGLDAGAQGACTMHSEMGRGLSGAPYIPAMLAIDAVCASSALSEKEAWLERLLTGELVTTSLAAGAVHLRGGLLNGKLTAVQSADKASYILAWTDDQQSLVLLPTGVSGVSLVERQTWDTTRRLFDVELRDIADGEVVWLAEGDEAAALIENVLAARDFALAADAVGGAAALLEATVEYLQTRVQFKRPLAMFQALKHRCADLKAEITAAEAMLFDSLRQVEVDASQLVGKAMAAKLLATATFAKVAEDALQLHGGIGMATEHPCHLYLKRALLSDQLGRGSSCYEQDVADNLFASL